MRKVRNDCLYTCIEQEGGILLWTTFTPSSIVLGQAQKVFDGEVPIGAKHYWRNKENKRTEKIFNILRSKDEEIQLIGIQMLHNIFNFKIKKNLCK